MPRVRVRRGGKLPGSEGTALYRTIRHGVLHPDYDPEAEPDGTPGPKVSSGDVIEVTSVEFRDFADKLELVDGDVPLTYTPKGIRTLTLLQGIECTPEALVAKPKRKRKTAEPPEEPPENGSS